MTCRRVRRDRPPPAHDAGFRPNRRAHDAMGTPEFKDEAVKMVIESSRPVAEVAREIQVNEGTLGNWVRKY